MHKPLAGALLALLPLVASASLQKRVSKQTAEDFPATLEAARAAWGEGRFSACLEALRDATALATEQRVELVLASMPAAPEGFERVERKRDQVQTNQMLGGVAALVGNVIEQDYRGPFKVRVTVSANSPMVQMLVMSFQNAALLPEGSELIEYEDGHRAVLKATGGGRSRELAIVIADEHLVQVDWGNEDEESLLGMWNQGVVDALAAALAK